MTKGHSMRYIKAVGALMALLTVVVAPPVLLIRFIGNPWPAGGIDLRTPLADEAIIGLLAAVLWVLWAQVLLCVVAEALAAARSGDVDVRIPGVLGLIQHLARTLITSIAIAVVSVPVAMRPMAASAGPVEATPTPTTPASLPTPQLAAKQTTVVQKAETHEVIVQRGDTLWSIAEHHLGDGARWTEIANLNEGRIMSTNQVFRSADLIRAGWTLLLPGKAADSSTMGEVDYIVQKGDTLSQIALDLAGDANAWPVIFRDSQELDQPVPLTNPDLIYPGQKIDLPNTPTPAIPADRTRQHPPEGATPGDDTPPTQAEKPSQPAGSEHDGEPSLSPGASAGKTSEPPATSAPTGQPATDRIATHGHDADDSPRLPGWVMPGLLGGGTLLAGSLLLALRRRRAAQHRTRRPGRVLPALEPQLNAVEKSVTVAGSTATSTVELLDELLKRLAGTLAGDGDALPDLAAVEVTEAAVALHLRQPVNTSVDGPWVVSDDGLLWVVDKGVELATLGPDPHDDPAPWPLLVTIGHDEHEGVWLLNIEDMHVCVSGDHLAAGDFARFIAAEIACNPWSQHTVLDLVGIASEVAVISPDRIHAHTQLAAVAAAAVTDAVHTIDRLAEQNTTTPAARARHVDPDPWPSRVVIVDNSDDSDDAVELPQLIGLVNGHPGRTATAVVLTGAECPNGFEIHIGERRLMTIPSVNLTATAVGLSVDEAHGCAALLTQADQADDSPAPEVDGDQPWQEMATATGSLRDRYRISRHTPTLEVSASVLDDPDDTYTSVAATTVNDLEALAPKVTESVRQTVAAADPDLDADLEAWLSTDCPRPRLTLLGPVGARTSGIALDRRIPFYTELFAYLTTRPFGATTDEVATALDIEPGRVRTDVNKVRDWLGVDPATGQRFLPDARHAPSAKKRGIGVYEIVGALVDADLFRRLRLRGESRGADGIHDLVRALRLITGPPLEKLRPSGWGWLFDGDRLDQHLICAIADVSHVVVTHGLHVGDLDQAHTAARIAVMAAPSEEIARLDLVAVLEAQGHTTEAERIVRDDVCNRSDDGQAPTELPERTEQIINARRWLHRTAI